MNVVLQILAVIGLVLLNGLFVAAEFALVKVRDTQLEPLVLRGHRRAKVARHLLANLNAYLSATQLGITMASLALGWFGEPIFTGLLTPALTALNVTSHELRHSISFAIGFSVITMLHITCGELLPKWIAIQHSLRASLWLAAPLRAFYLASLPFNWLLTRIAEWLMRRVGMEPDGGAAGIHTEDELRLMLGTVQKQAGATRLGREIVLNALDLRRRIARDVMRPRQEISVFDTGASIAECLDVAERTRYSRFPLCENGDMDSTLGVVHIKDLYAHRIKSRIGADLVSVAKKLIFVPETARLEKLLQLFLERKLHFAIVVDEYGGTTGMVTLENVLEELVGPIQDEFDQEQPLLVRRGEGVWDADGALPLHELSEIVGESLHAEGVTTTSGWVTQQLGGFPKPGDVISLGRHELRVEEMNGPRVARLRVTRSKEPS